MTEDFSISLLIALLKYSTVQYVEPQEDHTFYRHYLRNRSTSDLDVLGYIGIL